METNFTTPVGRLVQGSVFTGQDKDRDGNPLVYKRGANAGQPRTSYFIAIAISKTDPGWPALEAQIKAVAKAGFPTLFNADGTCLRPDFAFKIIDGDSAVPDQRGHAPNTKTGFPGHWVLRMTSGFAPKVFDSSNRPLIDPESIKRGYYIRVAGGIKANGDTAKPGVYLNFNMVRLERTGEEIVSGPSAEDVFGDAAPTPAFPEAPSADNTFLEGPAPTERKFNIGGQVMSESELLAKGWTQEQLAAFPTV